ncbi:hypothetical protein LUZ60_011263 [Juncus effusus]|nr:hypothetical protein LUZ60_011263 [Juncus effusus]
MSGELAPPPLPESANKCQFWLPNKRRYCANPPRPSSQFCGNHNPSSTINRVPCPIDSSHSVFQDSLDSHIKKCPLRKQIDALNAQPYYSKSINSGDSDEPTVNSAEKRKSVLSLQISDFINLISIIKNIHSSVVLKFNDSFLVPESCENLLNGQIDRKIPYQEKHVVQQASILGNMELFGILQNQNKKAKKENKTEEKLGVERESDNADVAVVEFGAGRGYLTQLLTDCYGINKVFLVERKSYRLKADRSLRQNESVNLERLRIDIEDLDLSGVDSLNGVSYLATGKHLCGPATDLTINCCINEKNKKEKKGQLKGLAIATCCHHLCQWKHYANKEFLSDLGVKKEEFHAITWFSSWAIDGDHKENNLENEENLLETFEMKDQDCEDGIEKIIKNMPSKERELIGFMCKEIIDTGRLLFLKLKGFDAKIVNYVSKNVSPENHLLIGKIEE